MTMAMNELSKPTLAYCALLILVAQGVCADDIRIVNGNVITMDDANPTASTVLIAENRIVSVEIGRAHV